MTTITALPDAPSRTDPATFSTKSDALLGALATFVTETNTVAGECVSNAATATTQAGLATTNGAAQVSLATAQVSLATAQVVLATTQATNSANSATAAAASVIAAGATLWVSGTTYAIGNARYSPLNGQTYRRLTAGAGTTDPSADSTNWIVVNGLTSEAIVLPVNNLPVVRPTLLLDFANSKTVDPRITFTRASTATRINDKGLIETVASGAPRIDYDPVTLACKGLLIEVSRTNLLTYSEQFDNAAWTKTATVTANTATAPDGTTTADTVSQTVTAQAVYQGASASGTSTQTASVYIKTSTATSLGVWLCWLTGGTTQSVAVSYNPATGTFSAPTSSGATGITYSATAVGSGWYRISLSGTGTDAANTQALLQIYDVSGGSSAYYLWGAQLEAEAFATSYIPTTSAQVTRAADAATMTGTNFSSWYRQDEGTFVVAADTSASAGAVVPIINAQLTGGADRHQIIVYSDCCNTVVSGVGNSPLGSNSSNSVKIAFAYKSNDFAASISGVSTVTDTSGSVPLSLTYMVLGSYDFGGATFLNGHIAKISYFPSRLVNATLQALSTP